MKSEKKEIPEEILKMLKDKNLFDEITIKEFDKKIVGEIKARRLIFLCSCGNLVENNQIASYNLLINDEAGSGKDYTTKNVLSLWGKGILIYKTRISPAVLTYWHTEQEEPHWTWDGKILYLEDIGEIIFNSDVFKVMCSSGSEATIVIEQKAVDLKIKGKPVMITTTASTIPNPELTRRFAIMNLTESQDQTEAIMKRHSEFSQKGIVPEYNSNITIALNLLQRKKVKIPYADKIFPHFPKNHVIMRTLYPRFLDFIKASAVFHQYQRKIDKDNFIIAEEQDYEIAREGIETIKSNKYMIPLTINQKKILHEFSKPSHLCGSLTELHNIFNFISLPALQTNLGILAKYGIISTKIIDDKEKYKFNPNIIEYFLNEEYNKSMEKKLPKFKEL